MSGKTTLAKLLIPIYQRNNIKTVVLDPLQDPTWNADFQTDDNDTFLQTMYQSRSCALFVDESGSAIGRYSGSMAVVATQSRHLGHKAHFITQRPSQLDKTIRDQCSTLFLFCVSKKDAITLADEFGYDEILRACKFRQGECLKITRFQKPIFMNVFTGSLGEFSQDETESEPIENIDENSDDEIENDVSD